MDTLRHEGGLAPTSEKTIHAQLLKAHDDVRSIIHTHPVSASTFAAARQPIKVTERADRELLGGDVEIASYGAPGSKKLAKSVVAAIEENRAVIMENHGVLVCGESLDDALAKCELVERLAARAVPTASDDL
jgi:ribulose-5-phosphate 4-epimerase/fuculose-1-phosphate aldolase